MSFILKILQINELLTCKFSFIDNTTKNQLIKLQVFSINFLTVSFKLSNLTKSHEFNFIKIFIS